MATTRRDLLKTTMLAGAAASLGLWPGAARAFRIEEDEAAEQLYLAACEQQSTHAQLVRELIAQIEGTDGHEKAVEAVRAMTCPVCGCRLAAAVDAANPS
jgi:rubrerythrin